MTNLMMSMAVFLRELYALYIALVFHSPVNKLKADKVLNYAQEGCCFVLQMC